MQKQDKQAMWFFVVLIIVASVLLGGNYLHWQIPITRSSDQWEYEGTVTSVTHTWDATIIHLAPHTSINWTINSPVAFVSVGDHFFCDYTMIVSDDNRVDSYQIVH